MNRTFIADLTPARARLIALMNRSLGMKIDRAVFEKADENRVTNRQFERYGIENETERAAIQFMIDMNFRAGLPTGARLRPRRELVIEAALEIAGVEYIMLRDVPKSSESFFSDLDYKVLIPDRKKVLVVDLDDANNISLDTAAKFFPRMLLHGDLAIQYAFHFGNKYSSVTRMGDVLYPAVANSIQAPYRKGDRQMILACGCFPDFLEGRDFE